MSWRRIVDARGDTVEVDWPKLAIVLVVAGVAAEVVLGLLPSPADYVALGVLAVVGIAVDIVVRRRDDGP